MHYRPTHRYRWLMSLSLLLVPALAVADCRDAGPRCVPIGEWDIQLAVGAGVRTNPLVNGSDIPLILIPQVSYYGERFFIDYLDIGVTLTEGPRFMLNAIVTPGSDGLYFFRSKLNRFVLDGGFSAISPNTPPRAELEEPITVSDELLDGGHPENSGQPGGSPSFPGNGTFQGPLIGDAEAGTPRMGKRRLAGMAGLEASAGFGPTEWQLQLLHDITGVHGGQEARLAVGTGTRLGGHDLGLTLGLSWKSDKLLDYYYGVSPAEAHNERPAYTAGSGTAPFARLSWGKPINSQWRLMGSLQYERLSSAVRNSPIIEDDEVLQVFFGGVYHF